MNKLICEMWTQENVKLHSHVIFTRTMYQMNELFFHNDAQQVYSIE